MKELEVTVAEARQQDVGRGICRLDPEIAKSLGISTGDILEIFSQKKKTAAKSWHGYPDDKGKGILRIDGAIRRNAAVSVNDKVKIRRIEAKDASKISFSPTDPLRIQGGEAYLRRILENRVMTVDDYIEIPIMGRKIVLMVTGHSPIADAVLVRDTTAVVISDKVIENLFKKSYFKDIIGVDSAIESIKESLFSHFNNENIVNEIPIENRILIIGPTGSGKSLLAKSLATELSFSYSDLDFYSISSKYWGESEKRIIEFFKEAINISPSVILIDHIEFFLADDEDLETLTDMRIKKKMIESLKDVAYNKDLIVVCTCHDPKILDKNLKFLDVFDKVIKIELPDKEIRMQLLSKFSQKMPLNDKIDLNIIAENTEGHVASSLKSIINKAYKKAIIRGINQNNKPEIVLADINTAIDELDIN